VQARNTQLAFEACGFELRSQIIWAKQQFAIGRGHYHVQHEPCFYIVRKQQGATGHWCGARDQATLWKIDKPQKSETGHSTQKPVECMRRPIMNNSSPGQAIYEPFSGSGTTIIAAEMTGRACHAIELNPAYVDVAVQRWQQFSGSIATLEADGRTFQQVSDDRYDADKNSKESYEAGIEALRDGKAKAGAEAEAGT
jgi:DNA modification methylase